MSRRAYRIGNLASTREHTGLLPVSPATIWRWVKSDKFPKPYKLGDRVTVWDAKEVDDFLASQRQVLVIEQGVPHG